MKPAYKLLIGAIILLLVCALVYTKCRSNKRVAAVVSYTTKEPQPVERWVDRQGMQHAKAEVQQVPKEVFDRSKDSLLREIKRITKANNLLQATVIKLQAKDSVFAPYVDTPTVGNARVFTHTDGCVDIDGVVTDSGVSVLYDVHPTVTIVSHWYNPGLFKPKKLYVEALTDKCTRVDTVTALVVQKPPKKFIETRGFAIAAGFILGALAMAAK